MKLAIVIGHNSVAQGAVRVLDGVPEYVWNSRLAEMIRTHDAPRIEIFRRVAGGGYSAEIDRVYRQVDTWGATATVELHFNSSENRRANGCLTLSSGTAGSLKLAEHIHTRMLAVMGGRDHGIDVRSRQDRGGRSLWQGSSPCIMTEPFFGSNAAECLRADQHIDELAEAIYRGAFAYMKGE